MARPRKKKILDSGQVSEVLGQVSHDMKAMSGEAIESLHMAPHEHGNGHDIHSHPKFDKFKKIEGN